MNRFFSKLDLRDIKIDPTGSRFPPDADETDDQSSHQSADQTSDHAPEQAAEPIEAQGTTPETETEPAPSFVADAIDAEREVAAEPEEGVSQHSHGNGLATDGNGHVPGEVAAVVGEVLKVSARSRPSAVAGAIAGVVREVGRAEVQAIGAGATNQAVKAVAIARDYLRETGIEVVCLPAFIDVTIENEDRTAIRLVVEPR